MITNRLFWYEVRKALLILLDAIECMLSIKPLTSDCRKEVEKREKTR